MTEISEEIMQRALVRIQSLAAKCEHLPDTDGLRRAYRDIDVIARVALDRSLKEQPHE